MEISSVTVGLPVSDLTRAKEWYQSVFELGGPDLEPVPGVVEYQVGPIWLQLAEIAEVSAGAEVITRFGVKDVARQHQRLSELGVRVGEIEHFEGAVEYFEFADSDGNMLSFYCASD